MGWAGQRLRALIAASNSACVISPRANLARGTSSGLAGDDR